MSHSNGWVKVVGSYGPDPILDPKFFFKVFGLKDFGASLRDIANNTIVLP
jgi:hypothetical protein